MSHYIRLLTNFWTHRKTIRLIAALGNDALWLPLRIWTYAAENQPDGDFSDYSAEELALLVGYTGDAQAMLQALLKAGFFDDDPLRIHDWKEHNSYHSEFAERARKAAKARWKKHAEKTGKDRIGKDKKGEETSNASSIPPQMSEIQLHGTKIGLPESEILKFWNYYESNGWMAGTKKMKKWTNAMANWKIRWEERRGPGGNGKPTVNPVAALMALNKQMERHDLYERIQGRPYPPEQEEEWRRMEKRKAELEKEVAGL